MPLQSILVPRSEFTRAEATAWVRRNGFKTEFSGKEVDITENYFRFRQGRPFKQKRYYMKTLPNKIKLVLHD